MPITKNDLQKIGSLMDEKLDKRFDDFAIIVNKGFTKTYELIEKNAQSIDRNAKAIDRNAKKIDRNCQRIDNLNARFNLLEKKSKILENSFINV